MLGEAVRLKQENAHHIAYRYDERYRILNGHAIRPDFYLPELDVYIEYWGMDAADYKIGMLKKQQLWNIERSGGYAREVNPVHGAGLHLQGFKNPMLLNQGFQREKK